MNEKFVNTLVLYALVTLVGVAVVIDSASVTIGTASAQALPISERVLPKYNITVAINQKPVVVLVMNKRLDDGNKMLGMHNYMLKTFTKYCSEGCDEKVRGDIREKIMKEAMRRKIEASHVIFK